MKPLSVEDGTEIVDVKQALLAVYPEMEVLPVVHAGHFGDKPYWEVFADKSDDSKTLGIGGTWTAAVLDAYKRLPELPPTKGVEDGITDAPVLTIDAPEMDYEHAGKVAYAEQRVVEFRAIPTGQKFAAHPEGHYIALTRPPAASVANIDELLLNVRQATPEELTAQAESYGKNYKPGPRQATPFMPQPEVDGDWPARCLQRAFVEGMKWWQFHHNGSTAFRGEVDEAEAEALRRYGAPVAPPTLPVPERTAEMEELMGKMRAGAEAVIAWKKIEEPASLAPLFDFAELNTPENILLLLDHIEGKSK